MFGRTAAQAYDIGGLQVRGRRAAARPPARSCCSTRSAVGVVMDGAGAIGALLVETKSGRRAVRGRDLHRLLGRRRPGAWAGAPFETGRRRRATCCTRRMMFRVERRRPGARAGEAWTTLARADARGASARGRYDFARQGAIIRPQKNAGRMARQRHAARATPRAARDRRHRRAAAVSAGEVGRPAPDRRLLRLPARRGAGLRERLHRSRSRRRSASARPAACSATTVLTRRRRARLRQLRRHHRRQRLAAGAARGRRRRVALAQRPDVARLQPAALPHAAAAAGGQPAGGRPLRLDDARGRNRRRVSAAAAS